MFSGIVQDVGRIISIDKKEGGSIISVKTNFDSDMSLGDSICVDGVCLTISDFCENDLVFNIVDETLNKSSLSELKVGGVVNLEKSLQYNEKISGHLVQGHVDGVAKCLGISVNDGSWIYKFEFDISLTTLKSVIQINMDQHIAANEGLTIKSKKMKWMMV